MKFQEGKCPKTAKDCKHNHKLLKDAVEPPSSYSPKASPRSASGSKGKPSKKTISKAKAAYSKGNGVMPPCRFYKAGNCTNGKSCPFPHTEGKAKPNKRKAMAYFGVAVGGAEVAGDEAGDTPAPSQDGEEGEEVEDDENAQTESEGEETEEEEVGEEEEEESSAAETEAETEEDADDPR